MPHRRPSCGSGCCATSNLPTAVLPIESVSPVVVGEKWVLHIHKMCCPVEADLIRKTLSGVSGILHLDFNLLQRELVVTHGGINRADLIRALRDVDMEPEQAEEQTSGSGQARSLTVWRDRWQAWRGTVVAGLAAVAAEVAVWIGNDETAPLVVVMAVVSILVGGLGTLKRGWIALRYFSLNINFLMSLAVLGAICIGQWAEAAMVVFLFGVAERLEALSLDKARNAVRELLAMTPETATIQTDGGAWATVAATTVTIGRIARIKPGERVALDGVVVSGRSAVNQAPITGESMPVTKESGHVLYAGSVNGSGLLEYRVTADFNHSTLARIIATVQEAQNKRAPMQRVVDTFAGYYTPTVLLMAGLIAVVPPLLWQEAFTAWFYNALVMLVVACPCALVISTPVTVVSGLAAGARRGILIKGGLYLEQAPKLRAIALDKTGTLTHGRPTMTDFIVLGEWDREQTLCLAASLEAHSEHPVAAAIVAAWGLHRPLLPVDHFEAITGLGARGSIQGAVYHIGNHRLLEELGLCSPAVEALLLPLEHDEKTVVVLASASAPLAIIAVADQMRATTPEAVLLLQDMGLAVTMLTGDNRATAQAIARHAGILDVRAELLPEEKLHAIEELTRRFGMVGMVGDGINDAPALARAGIGIAMGATGSATALESADVAIMNDDLRKVGEFVLLGQATRRILWENIALAVGLKGFFLILSAMGLATLWMAVLADMGTSLLVIFNGRRLLKFGENRQVGQTLTGTTASTGHDPVADRLCIPAVNPTVGGIEQK